MRVSAVVVTPAERDALWDWWTDYAEGDHATHAFSRYGSVKRRVIWQDPGKGAEFVDEGRVLGLPFESRTRVELHARERVSARAESNRGNLDLEYWFEALPGGGTRVTGSATFHEPREVRLVAPFTRPAVDAAFGFDLRAHVGEFEAAHGL